MQERGEEKSVARSGVVAGDGLLHVFISDTRTPRLLLRMVILLAPVETY